ncbi:MAG: nucleotidyltransferase domain-containing protein [Bacteroidales bacterium]|nr:nucleotidyltransferase domain-containing protein [Bacteroidales bacterium]
MENLIRKNIHQISELCERYGVRKLYAFGSVVSGKFSEENSDIDLLVELLPMSPMDKGEALLELWDQLEKLFNRKVDLVSDQPVKNPYFFSSLEETKKLIYDREKQEISI